jgi:hypothetical protein
MWNQLTNSHSILFRFILILSSHLILRTSQLSLCFKFYPPKPCIHFLSVPYMLHFQSIPTSSIWLTISHETWKATITACHVNSHRINWISIKNPLKYYHSYCVSYLLHKTPTWHTSYSSLRHETADIDTFRHTVRNMGFWRMGHDDPSKQLHTNMGDTAMSCSSVISF